MKEYTQQIHDTQLPLAHIHTTLLLETPNSLKQSFSETYVPSANWTHHLGVIAGGPGASLQQPRSTSGTEAAVRNGCTSNDVWLQTQTRGTYADRPEVTVAKRFAADNSHENCLASAGTRTRPP